MSDPHHRDPDPAALNELLRAFADHEPASGPVAVPNPAPPGDAPVADESDPHVDADAAGTDEATRPATLDELVVDATGAQGATTDDGPADDLESDELESDDPVTGLDDSPAIIVIDDYAGRPDAPPRSPVPDRSDDTGDDVERVVIEIDDEDLPDAVYMEGSLDRGTERTIVLIEDDDSGDVLHAESERDMRRGIEPRMRERRVAVKRAQGRKRLLWVALALAAFLVVVGVLAVLGSGWFSIQEDQLTVTGVVYTDRDELQEILDDLIGTPALLVDATDIEERIEQIPWVDDAEVTVDFPHAATVEIREREAVTTYAGPDGRHRVLDREGRVLAVLDGYPFAYVLLTGPDPVDLDAGEFAPRGYVAASELARNLTPSIRGQVESMEVTSDGSSLVLHLADGTDVRFGEARDLLNKLVRLETALRANPDREPGGTIDVSTSEVTL